MCTKSQMLVSHFDTCSDRIRTIYKPNTNSSGIPPKMLAQKWSIILVFASVIWAQVWTWVQGQRQVITRGVKWIPTPKFILVLHAISKNVAVTCLVQLCPFKKLQTNLHVGAHHQKGQWYELSFRYIWWWHQNYVETKTQLIGNTLHLTYPKLCQMRLSWSGFRTKIWTSAQVQRNSVSPAGDETDPHS